MAERPTPYRTAEGSEDKHRIVIYANGKYCMYAMYCGDRVWLATFTPSGRIGFIPQAAEAQFSHLTVYSMSR